ncbi:hypothetical protein ACWD5F_45410 [Streptomyces sp. NPDC002499]
MRRPTSNNGLVATLRSPVHHCLRHGDVVRSCPVAISRTMNRSDYGTCGGEDLTSKQFARVGS